MILTSQQVDFFETFGYLKFPGLLSEEIDWITDEFEKVFPMFETNHDGSKRTMIVPFIDQREKLSGLLDEPRIHGICTSLLGDDFNYMGSDGNYYVGDTTWHRDGINPKRRHIKIAFYLDRLDASNGALRVIPGTHRLQDRFAEEVNSKAYRSEQYWGIPQSEVPAQALVVVPGDILVFDHSTIHSSWNGNTSRRMFTLNLCARFQEEDVPDLREYMMLHTHYRRRHYFGQAMLKSAGAQRQRHLEQVSAQSDDYYERTKHLPELTMSK